MFEINFRDFGIEHVELYLHNDKLLEKEKT